jgi:outer membrane protein OmpA-like peptidoglycan-associated protein
MKTAPKLVLIVVGAAVAMFGLKTTAEHFGFGISASRAIGKAALPDIKDAVVADVQPLPYPTTSPDGCDSPSRNDVWAWNADIGWLYSNGGIDTTKGSLADKHGACQHFIFQPDTGQMQNDLLACAKDLSKSTECSGGVNFVAIMADGAGQFLAQLNPQLKKFCATCTAEIVGTTGFSRGEDALWGPSAWKSNPKAALGDGLIAGVLRDGDWDTAMKWAGDNSLKNNPDEKTFDEGAINWVNVADYTKAPVAYINGMCEDRKVVKDGKLTGEKRNVCVKAFVSWTPADVTAAKQKGGLVRVVSTKQYRSQMPSAIIGLKKWDAAHADKVAAMLASALEGGDQVKAFPEALRRAGDISAKVYGEENGDYWVRYYKGSVEGDATGVSVELGGSYADNMNDALAVFGLAGGSNNNVKATYETFAKIATEQYPELFKSTPILAYKDVVNTSYLLQAKSLLDNAGSAADAPMFDANADTSSVVSDRDYKIEFATGSAMLTPEGAAVVKQIKDGTAITGLTIVLSGHTDNTGNASANRLLSEARANTVKRALQQAAPAEFPDARFRVHGYGPDRPAADNATAEGRARNRRVQVTLAE